MALAKKKTEKMASKNDYSLLILTPTGSFSNIIRNIHVLNGVSWRLSAVFLHR